MVALQPHGGHYASALLSKVTYNTLIIGSPKTGKTTALINRTLSSMKTGSSVVVLDRYGMAIDEIAHRTPPTLWDTTTVLDLSHLTPTPLQPPNEPATVRDVLRDTARYGTFSTPVFDRLVFYLASSVGNLLDMKLMLLSDTFRAEVIPTIMDPVVRAFWEAEYDTWDAKKRDDRIQSTLNQLDVFLTEPQLRATFAYPLDSSPLPHNFLVKLPQAKLGTPTVRAAGLMLMAMVSRDTHLFVDDAELYQGTLLDRRLVEAPTTVSLTTLTDMKTVLNSTGEKLVFRLSGSDADTLTRELKVPSMSSALPELSDYRAYHVTAGGKLHLERQPTIQHRTFAGAPKALRSNRPIVSRRKVENAIKERVRRYLS